VPLGPFWSARGYPHPYEDDVEEDVVGILAGKAPMLIGKTASPVGNVRARIVRRARVAVAVGRFVDSE
jgi:hypothetical protein